MDGANFPQATRTILERVPALMAGATRMNARSSRRRGDSQWSGSPSGFFLERTCNQMIQLARQTVGFDLRVPRIRLEFIKPHPDLREFCD